MNSSACPDFSRDAGYGLCIHAAKPAPLSWGWLKGINSSGGTDSFEMGQDGHAGRLNQYTAQDAIGLTLNYFGNDYTAINGHPFPGVFNMIRYFCSQ
ncbi:hypothetical protein [Longitalea luteola]|uniref:hypothetical protein n=1 Tax=Longitalea luteola TaxID=2812563 RepID=UPI001A972CA2|nr:hypothetical protein [Longitalea luteola]